MNVYAVITGDITNFTQLADDRRGKLIADTEKLIRKMVKTPKDAQVFRGDSYQLVIEDVSLVISDCIRLICWF